MEAIDATWRELAARVGVSEGWHVRIVDETGSTNADLLDAAVTAGAPHGSVLVARHQTAGRGRLDRRWDAPPGANLLVSILFRNRPGHPLPEHLHELTQRVALAALEASVAVASVQPLLKWPNDLLVDGAKLAGVLAQAGTVDGAVDHVVVGVGINVGWAPEGGARLGEGIDPLAVLAHVLRALDAQPADIHDTYCAALGTLGMRVRVELPGDGEVVGRAVDVGRDGRLVVLDECAITHRIDTGDVVHLRPID
jgi:BirA family transcriptional regulator, biotin operon repressor / biotin---[acetyl-CoA-carboxylase] ligase